MSLKIDCLVRIKITSNEKLVEKFRKFLKENEIQPAEIMVFFGPNLNALFPIEHKERIDRWFLEQPRV